MYIFFSHPFAVTVLNPQFDPEFLFNGILLHMAHPPYASPSSPLSPSIETNPSTDSSSSSSSGRDQVVPELAARGFAVMENGFYSP